MYRKPVAITALLFIMIAGFTQPDCRSILGAHLKPIGNLPVSWAVEGTGALGVMPNRTVANWNLYGALDYTSGKHQLYFEGAYKDWYNSASNPDGNPPQTDLPDYNRPTRYNWGFREMNYRFKNESLLVKAGIQGLKTDDYFLFDERMLGLSASKVWNGLSLSVNTGTVSQRLARFQDVCGTRHIYNLFHRSQFNFVGDKPGETNFAATFLKWTPSGKKTSITTTNSRSDTDEFSADEFSSDEFSNLQTNVSEWKWKEVGIFFYEEFGSGFHEYKYYSGAFSTFEFPHQFSLKAEIVDQYILNDHALAFWFSLAKTARWNNGTTTTIDGSYLAKIDITPEAHFYPAFSNLFLGEVMRLDAIDLPLVSGSIKHQFNGKLKPTLQLNGVAQRKGNHSREADLLAGIKLFGHARLTGICSYIASDLLIKDYWMTRAELRIAF